MAKNERTIEQRQVIAHRGGDLLVSASAGSGKTTVLIEHVMELVLDPVHPVDIDHLLIATFTNAAAEEMRDRLAEAIDARIREGSGDVQRLRRQRLLIPHAHISTLDAYFNRLVRDHYQKLDIDPDFRTADEGELKLLQEDVADALFEQRFHDEDPGFFALMDAYGGDKSEKELKEQMIRLHGYSQSAPDPERWLRACAEGMEAGLNDPVILDHIKLLKKDLQSMLDSLSGGIKLLTPIDSKILPNLEDDCQLLQRLIDAPDASAFLSRLYSSSFSKLATIRKASRTDEEWAVIDLRSTIKKKVDSLRGRCGLIDPSVIDELAPRVAFPMKAFAELIIDFDKAYREAKLEKNILDFSDVSHKALQLLKEDPEIEAELKSSFEEIIIDEFQDINRLQEEILRRLSGTANGRGNRFMVGDVKQSIYGFRMAEPDIFQDKYDRFSDAEDAPCRRIDLNANFRSRHEVLDAVNAVFGRLMTPDCGRVDYRENAMLRCGASYCGEGQAGRYQTELLLTDDPETSDDRPEFRAIADRILELTDKENGLDIFDKKLGISRRAEYRDIVILARSANAISADCVDALREAGIPAIANKKTGFFNAPEIRLLCSLLKIIDDPRQDIPLMAVLVSPMFGLSEDLLLRLVLDHRASNKTETLNCTLYDACLEGKDPLLDRFFAMYGRFRDYAGYHSIHELLSLILEETGYLYYAMALADGSVRRANIEMLLERAIDFEATSYSGIFQFNRYLEQLKKYEIDYGEADVVSERDNVVRVLSIHQSKGLEYPIVFLADTSRRYNLLDARSAIPHHPVYGIRANYMDRDRNVKLLTLSRDALAAFVERRNREEELRILYVAMTRAREKLIITGTDKKKKEEEGPGLETLFPADSPLPAWKTFSAENDLALIRMAIGESHPAFSIRHISPAAQEKSEERRLQSLWETRKQIESLDPAAVYDEVMRDQLTGITAFSYPWSGAIVNRMVYAVSDLKKKAADREVVIRADGDEGAGDAAKRGTAYHLLMAKVDPSRGTEILYVKEQLTKLMKQGQIDPEIGAQLHPEWIRTYYTTSIGHRTAAAHAEGDLYREKPFILGKPAEEVDPSNSAGDLVMIKGVIDNFFMEEDGIVLVDYKTDRIRPGEEGLLADRYRTQLLYYAAALENAFKRPVKEMFLYSFVLGKAIEVKR